MTEDAPPQIRRETTRDPRPEQNTGDRAGRDRTQGATPPRACEPKKQRKKGRDADKQPESSREHQQGMAVLHSVAL
ncbi:MAG: hypothetical protein AMXMBFR77_11480 [Phycisphaerales bacterium]|nr:MAG: hypothetical protein BroJett004_05240 [Planctomycetota bacterium]